MKAILSAVLLITGTSHAQQAFRQQALLIKGPNEASLVWISAADKANFIYFDTAQGVDPRRMLISEPEALWLMEPPQYSEAMELFQARKYEEARELFASVRRRHLPLRSLKDNHSSLAAFYEMESLRNLGQLDELNKALENFLPDDRNSLTREHHQRQLEFYALWDAIRTKSWPRLEKLARDKLKERIPGYQRAQAGYALGLALESSGKPLEAINAYNIAMTADTGASETLTRRAALNALRLYAEDEELKVAMKLHGTPDEDTQSSGRLRLEEAASLASLYELTLGGGEPLPDELKALINYLPETPAAADGE